MMHRRLLHFWPALAGSNSWGVGVIHRPPTTAVSKRLTSQQVEADDDDNDEDAPQRIQVSAAEVDAAFEELLGSGPTPLSPLPAGGERREGPLHPAANRSHSSAAKVSRRREAVERRLRSVAVPVLLSEVATAAGGTPSSAAQTDGTSFDDLVDALQEWREALVSTKAFEQHQVPQMSSSSAGPLPAENDGWSSDGTATMVSDTPFGSVRVVVQTTSVRVCRAVQSQFPADARQHRSAAPRTGPLVAVPALSMAANDCRSPEVAGPPPPPPQADPSPLDAGSDSTDLLYCRQDPEPPSAGGNSAMQSEQRRLVGGGIAFQRSTTIEASLRFRDTKATHGRRPMDVVAPFKLGAPQGVHGMGEAEMDALQHAQTRYSSSATERQLEAPLAAIDRDAAHVFVGSVDTPAAARRDVARGGVFAAFMGAVLPATQGVALHASAFADVRTGATALVLGRRGCGKTTAVLHALAAGDGRLALVGDGVVCVGGPPGTMMLSISNDPSRVHPARARRIVAALRDASEVAVDARAVPHHGAMVYGSPLSPLVPVGTCLGLPAVRHFLESALRHGGEGAKTRNKRYRHWRVDEETARRYETLDAADAAWFHTPLAQAALQGDSAVCASVPSWARTLKVDSKAVLGAPQIPAGRLSAVVCLSTVSSPTRRTPATLVLQSTASSSSSTRRLRPLSRAAESELSSPCSVREMTGSDGGDDRIRFLQQNLSTAVSPMGRLLAPLQRASVGTTGRTSDAAMRAAMVEAVTERIVGDRVRVFEATCDDDSLTAFHGIANTTADTLGRLLATEVLPPSL